MGLAGDPLSGSSVGQAVAVGIAYTAKGEQSVWEHSTSQSVSIYA